MVSQIGGLGLGALGMSKAFGAKEGGEVPGYADGGVTGGKDGLASNVAKLTKFLLSSQNPEQDVRRMSGTPIEKYLALQKVQQLRGATQNQAALDRGVPQGTVMDEAGLAGINAGVMDDDVFTAAGGGIVAFQYGGSSMGAEMGEMPEQEPPRKPTPEEVDAAIAARRARGENLGLAQILDIQAGNLGLPAALPQQVTAKPVPTAVQQPLTQTAPGAQLKRPPAPAVATAAPAVKPEAPRPSLLYTGETPKEAFASKEAEMEKRFPSELKDRLEELKAQGQQAIKDRDADRWLAVAMGGFAAAAGQSPYALQNFAQGLGLTTKEIAAVNKDFRKAEDLRKQVEREERKANRLESMQKYDAADKARTRVEDTTRQAQQADAMLQAKFKEIGVREMAVDVDRQKLGILSKAYTDKADQLKSDFVAAMRSGDPKRIEAAKNALRMYTEATQPQRFEKPVDPLFAALTGGTGAASGVKLTPDQQKLLDKYK